MPWQVQRQKNKRITATHTTVRIYQNRKTAIKVRSDLGCWEMSSDGYRHFTEIPKNSEIPIPKCKTKKTDYTDTEVKKYRFSHFGIEARSIETVEKITHNRLGHVGLDP